MRRMVIWIGIPIFCLLAVSVAVYRSLFPSLPKPPGESAMVWLDQGWTFHEREMFYRIPQGSLVMPYSWFLALESPEAGNHTPFSAEQNLVRYNLIPGPPSRLNPDRLPIGLTKQVLLDDVEALGCGAPPCAAKSKPHSEWLSYTCAACHTTLISFRGTTMGIDGGRGRWNFSVFNRALANVLLLTAFERGMSDRFAAKVLRIEQQADTPGARAGVRKELRDFLTRPKVFDNILADMKRTYPTEEGYGRIDAFGRGANAQFGSLDPRNVQRANAPVVIPPLWHVHDYDWVQSVGAIRQPLGRNITESWELSRPWTW